MNIFYLHENPKLCAEYHVDKHCVKMIVESCQLLSTAHRLLDGEEYEGRSKTGRKARRWKLSDERETLLYSATHINHPSAVWCRASKSNYIWLHNLLIELLAEYTYRYEKTHKCTELANALRAVPTNILDTVFTAPTPAMPDEYKVPGNVLQSYHNYYNGEKQRMFAWKKRQAPSFINNYMKTTEVHYAAV